MCSSFWADFPHEPAPSAAVSVCALLFLFVCALFFCCSLLRISESGWEDISTCLLPLITRSTDVMVCTVKDFKNATESVNYSEMSDPHLLS